MPRRPPEKAVVAFFGEGRKREGQERREPKRRGVKERDEPRRGTNQGELHPNDNWRTDGKQPASPSADRRPAGPVQPKEETKDPGQQPAKRRVCDRNGPTRREIPEKEIRSCRHTRPPVTLSSVHPNAGSTYHPSPFRPSALSSSRPNAQQRLLPVAYRPSVLTPGRPYVRQRLPFLAPSCHRSATTMTDRD